MNPQGERITLDPFPMPSTVRTLETVVLLTIGHRRAVISPDRLDYYLALVAESTSGEICVGTAKLNESDLMSVAEYMREAGIR